MNSLKKMEVVVDSSIETITPGIAKEWLKKNRKNRGLVLRHVKALAHSMENGQWKINGESIKFDTSGNLLDGQHRLQAVIDSEATIESFVVRNLSDCAVTMDTGRKRYMTDLLSIQGESYPTLLGAALQIVYYWSVGTIGNAVFYDPVSYQDLFEILKTHPGIRESCHIGSLKGLRQMLPPSISVGLHYIFSTVNKEAADKFFRVLMDGEGLTKGNPIYALRERLLRNSASNAKLSRRTILSYVIKSWNSLANGQQLKILKKEEEIQEIADEMLSLDW